MLELAHNGQKLPHGAKLHAAPVMNLSPEALQLGWGQVQGHG